MKSLSLLLVASSVSALVGCSSGSTIDSASCPTGSTLDYATFGKGFVEKYCSDCHTGSGQQGGVSLEGVGNIQKYKAEAYKEAGGENTSMPPSGKTAPSADERKKFGEWLACGAK